MMMTLPALRRSLAPALLLAAFAAGAALAAQTGPEPIRYTLSFPAPHTHYVEVEAIVPTGGQPRIELMMAVWTPGSYLVREYARHVEAVEARGPSGPLRIAKSSKNRWQVDTGGQTHVAVSYRVYAREMSVRTNWVERDFALINGAPTFLTLVEDGPRPHDVRLVLPSEWRATATGLRPAPASELHHYRAADFDTLVDSPIVAGNPAVYEFEVEGTPHYLVNVGEGGVWDGPRSAADAERVVRENLRMWGGTLPYDRYVILNMITETGGGLEHGNSTVLMTSRWATRSRGAYLNWLSLLSHEVFHTWNIKRLRPVELGPFDYENENYTTALWMVEGFTSYFGDLLVHRAGLSVRAEYLGSLSNSIRSLQSTPGRLVQSVEEASFDTWIKFYRPDENTINSSVNYYTKGEVIGFLLDARIRRATDNARSLEDVMRQAYERYGGEHGFERLELRELISEVAGVPLEGWLSAALDSTAELDYAEALDWYGLRFRTDPAPDRAWLGLGTRVDGGRLVVSHVRRATPGHEAGFNVDDEILAIGDFRVRPDQFSTRMEQLRPGERLPVLIARRDALMRLDVTFGREPAREWTLEIDPEATDRQRANLDAWLTGR